MSSRGEKDKKGSEMLVGYKDGRIMSAVEVAL